MTALPIESILPQLHDTLLQQNRVLVVAPPGAGKSTHLPLSLLNQASTQQGQIWLLEPRRVAAEQVARRLASALKQTLGESIGLITGDFSKTGKHNQIVVMTEGVFAQKLLNDNEISNCHTVIFDEFHERSLHSDLGLALATQCQEYLRDDLTIIIMSATLDSTALVDRLGAHLLESEGRSFPVTQHYVIKKPELNLEQNISNLIQSALKHHEGDILVFLPGIKEISRTQTLLNDALSPSQTGNTILLPLHGQLANQEQQKVLKPSEQRKVILSTDIAKTSITIEGVTVEIDSGLERQARFNTHNAMDELITVQASQASMIQRAGRAGRIQAGDCYRLLSEEAFNTRPPFSLSAIELSDLTPFSLSLGAWGSFNLDDYLLLNKPDKNRYQNSLSLLHQLDAIDKTDDSQFTLSNHGKTLSAFSIHPRLAHMLNAISDDSLLYSACLVAAILSEGDPLHFQAPNSDLSVRMELFKYQQLNRSLPKYFEDASVKYNLAKRIIKLTQRLAKQLNVSQKTINPEACGILCMLAYPDRLAQKRGNGYRMRSGKGVQVMDGDATKLTDFLAIAHVSSQSSFNSTASQSRNTIRLACDVNKKDIIEYFDEQITSHSRFVMQSQLMEVKEDKLGELVLSSNKVPAEKDAINQYHLQEIKASGLAYLPLKENDLSLLHKLNLAHKTLPDIYPSFEEDRLIKDMDNWLIPFMNGKALKNIPYMDALLSRIDWSLQTQLKQDFPSSLPLPSGRNATIDYSHTPPVVKAKLQECFGLNQSPTIAKGQITLNVHLLSPAQKPLAMTHDLAFFWKEAYPEVRKENRGRYAKHPWPEDPLTAVASSKTKKRMEKD